MTEAGKGWLLAVLLALTGGCGGDDQTGDDDSSTSEESSSSTSRDAGREDARSVSGDDDDDDDNGTGDSGREADSGVTGDTGVTRDSGVTGDSGGGSQGITVPGTWIAQVETPGVMEVPVLGAVDANIQLVARSLATEEAGTFNTRFELCAIATTSTPDPTTLAINYPAATIATLHASESIPAFSADVGEPFDVPDYVVLSGLDSSSESVDADDDGNPGVTLPITIGDGLVTLNVYVGLNISTSFTATASAADKIAGTVGFSVTGEVFGSDNPIVVESGSIDVKPSNSSVPFMARRLDGDVPCKSVLSMFP